MPAPGDEATTHVAQPMVPVVVIVPPVMGEVVAMLVTVPLAAVPPSAKVHVVLEVEHESKCPLGITTAGPRIVLVVVAALPIIV